MGGDDTARQSFPCRALDDLRRMKFPLFGRMGFVVWELVFASAPAATGALAPDSARLAERAAIATGLAVAGVLVGMIVLYILLLPVAIWRQRQEARAALQVAKETPFVIVERDALHVPLLGHVQIYAGLSINYLGSERATIEGLTARVNLGFLGEGTNWGTNTDAATPSSLPQGSSHDLSGLSWQVQDNGLWELLGLPMILRGGSPLVLPPVGVQVVDEAKVREAYQHPDGAHLYLDVSIRSSIGTDKLAHSIPVIFCDEAGVDLVASKPVT